MNINQSNEKLKDQNADIANRINFINNNNEFTNKGDISIKIANSNNLNKEMNKIIDKNHESSDNNGPVLENNYNNHYQHVGTYTIYSIPG